MYTFRDNYKSNKKTFFIQYIFVIGPSRIRGLISNPCALNLFVIDLWNNSQIVSNVRHQGARVTSL